MQKYIEIIKFNLKVNSKFIIDYIFFILGYAIHIFVFNELWDFILKENSVSGYTRQEIMWYIIIAELIVCCNYAKYKKISETIKNGDICNMLIKPIDYIYYLIAEDLSIYIKFGINAVIAFVIGMAMVGSIQISIIGLIFIVVSCMISVFMGMLFQYFLGIIAFFTEENRAFWLVIQKLFFLVVFTPLEFYPKIMQKIFIFLPTTYYVYSPARICTKFSIMESTKLLAIQILCIIFLYVIIRILYKKGVKKINVNGG